jgi:hypothetical protein
MCISPCVGPADLSMRQFYCSRLILSVIISDRSTIIGSPAMLMGMRLLPWKKTTKTEVSNDRHAETDRIISDLRIRTNLSVLRMDRVVAEARRVQEIAARETE